MRLLILGASGGCGTWLTRIAVSRGHQVTAVTRAGQQGKVVGATDVVIGDVLDRSLLQRVTPHHDAVLCALGIRRAGKSPWSTRLSPATFMADVSRLLIPVMQSEGVSRLIAISAAGVGDSAHQLTWPVRTLLSLGNVGVAYRDLAVMEGQLAMRALDWLAVRPVTLVHGDVSGAAREVDRFTMRSTVRRADVAQWMIERIEQPALRSQRFVTLGT
jgi:putative NADH-flavin reductase